MGAGPADNGALWWRSAVIYQVYIRSFADGDGDGIGDIRGLRSRLPYLAELGVDAVWITPWYPSPMKDGGYDVADLRAIEPLFGTVAEAEAMIAEAHDLGLRILLDIVPNHFSDQHPWFQEALAAAPGSPERARFIFRDGLGSDGSEPPNDWMSNFGGLAWTRVTESDGRPGQWYLHLFTPEQPDVDWTNPEVRDEFAQTMRFWFGLGVDGFRIDVAHGLAKAEGLPDVGSTVWPPVTAEVVDHPHWDRDDVHDIYRSWRSLADTYDDPRVFVAEAWVHNSERLAQYVRADELHTAFNFDFLLAPWDAEPMRESIIDSLAAHEAVGAPPTWVLSNHDTVREVSRYARPQDARRLRKLDDLSELPADFDVGRRRARAAALLMLALPGGAYVYQGEELGLAEVEDLPEDVLQDPGWEQSGRTERGRDGCRVPIPWSGERASVRLQPRRRDRVAVASAAARAGASSPSRRRSATRRSMLELYRRALRPPPDASRRSATARSRGSTCPRVRSRSRATQDSPASSTSSGRSRCRCRTGRHVLLSSGPLTDDGRVPSDTSVWLTT